MDINGITVFGQNQTRNVTMTTQAGSSNRGSVTVWSSNNQAKAGMLVDSGDNGYLWTTGTKDFRIPHPGKASSYIRYSCIEGPEAAVYERGTATLQGGRIQVDFSETFSLVGNPEHLTVIVTPLSGESKGLAVVEKNQTGFVVQELYKGSGNYEFDWEVKTIRKGYEDYKTIIPSKDFIE